MRKSTMTMTENGVISVTRQVKVARREATDQNRSLFSRTANFQFQVALNLQEASYAKIE